MAKDKNRIGSIIQSMLQGEVKENLNEDDRKRYQALFKEEAVDALEQARAEEAATTEGTLQVDPVVEEKEVEPSEIPKEEAVDTLEQARAEEAATTEETLQVDPVVEEKEVESSEIPKKEPSPVSIDAPDEFPEPVLENPPEEQQLIEDEVLSPSQEELTLEEEVPFSPVDAPLGGEGDDEIFSSFSPVENEEKEFDFAEEPDVENVVKGDEEFFEGNEGNVELPEDEGEAFNISLEDIANLKPMDDLLSGMQNGSNGEIESPIAPVTPQQEQEIPVELEEEDFSYPKQSGVDLEDTKPSPSYSTTWEGDGETESAQGQGSIFAGRSGDFDNVEHPTGAESAFEKYSEKSKLIIYKVFEENLLKREDREKVVYFIENYQENEVIDFIEKVLRRDSLLGEKKQYQSDVKNVFVYSVVGFLFFILCLGGYVFTRDYVNAYRLYQEGLRELEEKRFFEAENSFNEATDFFESRNMYNQFGQKYLKMQRYDDALFKYQKATQLFPKDKELQYSLIKTYFSKEDYQNAEVLVNEKLKERPDDVNLWYWLGRLDLKNIDGDETHYQKAKKIFQTLMNRNSKNLEYPSYGLMSCILLDDFEGARSIYRYIVAKNPKYMHEEAFPAYFRYLYDYYVRNYTGEGLKKPTTEDGINSYDNRQLYVVYVLDRLSMKILRGPDKYVAYYGEVAEWYMNNKDMDGTKRILDSGKIKLTRVGEYVNASGFLLANAIYYYRMKDYPKSLNYLQEIARDNPNDPRANYYLGEINLKDIKDLSRANQYYQTANFYWKDKQVPEYKDLIYKLAYTYYAVGVGNGEQFSEKTKKEVLESLNWFNQYEDVSNDSDVEMGYVKGNIFLRLRHYDFAIVEYQKMLEKTMPYYKYYVDKGGNVSQEVTEKLQMLSDVYNNLGVAQISKYYKVGDDAYRRDALKNFVDSIDLKTTLNAPRGIPNVNYVRLSLGRDSANPDSYSISDNYREFLFKE